MDVVEVTTPDTVRSLLAGEHKPAFASTGERVADILRGLLIEGRLEPGTRITEEVFALGLNVSRNTLREALRLLAHERLVVHQLNRGVFVRELDAEEIASIYQVREFLEIGAVRHGASHTAAGISRVRLAVTQALEATENQDWAGVGTANMNFHTSLVALAGNPRLDAMIRQTLAEQRLSFHVMKPLKDFHEPYLPSNVAICSHLEQGRSDAAADALADYLRRARDQLVEAYRSRDAVH